MKMNQLMSRLALLGVLLPGCYGSAPQRGPSPVVSCTTDAECMRGQLCAQVRGLNEPVCLTRCNTRVSQRCTNGALCMTEFAATVRDFCMPGAGLPQTFEVAERCSTPGPCVFGESCWFPVRAEVDGMCAPLCADDTECPRGSGCVRGGCLQICDSHDLESCPEGLTCDYLGQCQPDEVLADCSRFDRDNVPNNCPIGTACVGVDEDFECVSPDWEPGCSDGGQFFLPTARCYPRSQLRPIR